MNFYYYCIVLAFWISPIVLVKMFGFH